MDTKSYHIVADGFSSIKVTAYNPGLFSHPTAERAFLDKFVAEQTARAQARNGLFFDGDLVGIVMSSLVPQGQTLKAEAQHLKYSEHAGLFRSNPEAPVQAAYVNSLAITQDGYLVFGTTQATEADWMGKLGLPAGGLNLGPDGFPSLGTQIYRELSEELGIASEYHFMEELIPGWMNGGSKREGNYHVTVSFVTPLRLNKAEMDEYFKDWKAANEKWMNAAKARGEKVKVEFKDLRFIPNDQKYMLQFIAEQDSKGKNANLLGKSLDVVEEWARKYNCDPEQLKESKKLGTQVYLPQPKLF